MLEAGGRGRECLQSREPCQTTGNRCPQQPERRPTPASHDRRRPPRPKLRAAVSVTPTGPAPRLPPQKPHAQPAVWEAAASPRGQSQTLPLSSHSTHVQIQTRLPLTATASPSTVPHVQPQDGSARPPLCKTTAHAQLCSWGFVRALTGGGCRAEGVCGRVTGRSWQQVGAPGALPPRRPSRTTHTTAPRCVLTRTGQQVPRG